MNAEIEKINTEVDNTADIIENGRLSETELSATIDEIAGPLADAAAAPKADQSYVDSELAPIDVVATVAALVDDPFGFGHVATFTAFTFNSASPQTWAAANDARLVQCITAGTISKIGFWVEVASGNVSVGVYRKNGSGRSAVPGTRAAVTSSVTIPGTGYREIALPAPIRVEKGDYLALSCDNATASFTGMNGASRANLGPFGFGMNTAHPLPSLYSGGFATTGKLPLLFGIA